MDTCRRTVLAAGTAGAAALVAGCGNGGGDAGGETTAPAKTEAAPAESPSSTGKPGESPSLAGKKLAAASEIPVGGGKVFASEKVVVTQPTAGDFKAFSAVCTHQGCTVRTVADGTIDCPCHDSKFRVSDGSVAEGPATKPLPPEQIMVSGDTITLA
ncbi:MULTISPECIES: Rieske (2Fe-2S) protein [unclassified Streptomyces]|uniref:Rieske (2Fe-2S) protein n=1 Tax=unclassified Streptomyces TaxID=2593676 RepID=UPI00365950E4